MGTNNADKRINDSRWWEFYFVRYFVGTVIGSAIILYLNSPGKSSLSNLILPGVNNVSNLDVQLLPVLLALGLAFCYIASSPILVLHAARCSFLAKDTKSYKKVFWTTFLLIALLIAGYHFCSNSDLILTLSLALFTIVLLIQVIPLIFSLKKEGELAHNYYSNLAKARSQDTEEASQYMESYKHLREHGNAFFILLFELVLGVILSSLPNPNIALITLMIWISPAALVWLTGTVLEYRFSKPKP